MQVSPRRSLAALSLLAVVTLGGCASRATGTYYYQTKAFQSFDISNIYASKSLPEGVNVKDILSATVKGSQSTNSLPEEEVFYTATVAAGGMKIYRTAKKTASTVTTLKKGEVVEVAYYAKNTDFWQVRQNGSFLGYCEAGAAYSGLWDNYYAYLPVEYGKAPNASGERVDAKSNLVDVRLYTDAFVIKMQLAVSAERIGSPMYSRNLCMLQYDTLQKLLVAAELFAEDGYRIVIYDAYRPTSVQWRWFEAVGVHKWVANPTIGMGGIHDRGVAVDMTLMDENGVELDMPTKMHEFSTAAARSAPMTDEQKKNVQYMTDIMVKAGFTYINSEWWHFQDSLIANYLPTDHPIDEIPLVYREVGES